MEIIWILVVLFVLMTMAYVVFAVFLPEWIGIQGKKAKSIEDTHREDSLTSSETTDLNKK